MRAQIRSHRLPFLALLGVCACSGHVENRNSNDDDPSDQKGLPTASSGGNLVVDDGDAGGGNGDDGAGGTTVMPIEPAGTGGVPLTPIDINLWCPTGDQWDMMFGDTPHNLGGAASNAECPELPSTSYSESYCVATFTSTLPVALSDSSACCYEIDTIFCR